MGTEAQAKTQRRAVRRVLGDSVAINVLEMNRFIRRGFWGRMKWLFFGR